MKKVVNIHIGGCIVSNKPIVISTVLGSCVAVCLYDQVQGIGGMNHILVPGKAGLRDYNNPTRFGINAMELLINSLMKAGAKRLNLSAKVFGGAQVLAVLSEDNHIGLINAEFVIDYLVCENIRIVNHDIGGMDSRRIYFHTDTGDVLLKRLNSIQQIQKNINEEAALRRKIWRLAQVPGKVTFFD